VVSFAGIALSPNFISCANLHTLSFVESIFSLLLAKGQSFTGLPRCLFVLLALAGNRSTAPPNPHLTPCIAFLSLKVK